MPRRARYAPTGHTYHVVNRGNDRQRLFFDDADYQAFIRLLHLGKRRHAVTVFGLCVMPNHFHTLVRPDADRAMSAYFHWVQCCYACDLRARTGTLGNGHLFQQRFWCDRIQDDHHFVNVLRYIEANPVSAGLVTHAQLWPWSSAALRGRGDHSVLDYLPLPLPSNWFDLLNDEALDGLPF
jgi:putative transposase